jgi:hypothetical protein
MKTALLSFMICFAIVSQAQTKIIAHKSHSGNTHNFSKAYQSNKFDIGHSNFGEFIQPEIKQARLDSLIFMNDTCQIMVTTEVCSNRFGADAITKERNEKNGWNKAIEVSKDKKSSVWKAGRDTVYHHPLFSQNESLDYVKTTLKSRYHFVNKAEGAVFVGYSNNDKAFAPSNSSILVRVLDAKKGLFELVLNGRFSNFWNCYHVYSIVGIEKKDDENSTWVSVQNPKENNSKHSQSSSCELPYTQFKNETIKDFFWIFKNQRSAKYKLNELPGTYRLFVEIYDTKKIIYSNEFTITP